MMCLEGESRLGEALGQFLGRIAVPGGPARGLVLCGPGRLLTGNHFSLENIFISKQMAVVSGVEHVDWNISNISD